MGWICIDTGWSAKEQYQHMPDVRISPETKEVYCQHRALPSGDVYFLVNNSTEPVSGTFAFRAQSCDRPHPGDEGGPGIGLTLEARSGLFVVSGK